MPVDIYDDGLIDPEAIKNAITSKTVGVMPTQLNGRVCQMDKIMDIAFNNNLFLVEDAAQALGAKFKGQSAGTFGFASAISFYPAKILGCLGDGGAVIVNNEEYFDILYELHDHGRGRDGKVKRWGRNSRLDNIQAAILDFRLTKHSEVIDRRREIAGIYQERLQHIEQLKLPPGPNNSGDNFDVFQNYELLAEKRDSLREFLLSKHIGTLIQWGGQALSHINGLGIEMNLPKTNNYFNKCIMLPMNTFLDDHDVDYVCDSIFEFYN